MMSGVSGIVFMLRMLVVLLVCFSRWFGVVIMK